MSQNFRMVDHIEFESPQIIEQFLQFWRKSGVQRAGFLYGRYEVFAEVPLGAKAVVSCIYEPPQEAGHDWIQLAVPDPNQIAVDALANSLGLELVGIVYTDLTDDGTGTGQVICKRHADSYFLSSAECIFSAKLQNQHRVTTKYSSSHKFGSRFVTCVISGILKLNQGNEDGGIDIMSYQVSIAAEAMVRDGIIEASVEPALMRVKPTSNEQYIPEVFYKVLQSLRKYKNAYNLLVQEAAKPTFPVEYLLVTV